MQLQRAPPDGMPAVETLIDRLNERHRDGAQPLPKRSRILAGVDAEQASPRRIQNP